MILQHFVPISGGKDSAAVACLAVERRERDPSFRPRFQFADTENENPLTIEHIDYLADALSIEIERVSIRDVPGWIDEEAFERRRQAIRRNWPVELRRKRHASDCADKRKCDCPIIVSPAVSAERIEQAVANLKPTGNAFIDLCMILGRFPSKMAKFCTDKLKLLPLNATKRPIWDAGGTTIDWVGERAQESPGRARKPMLQRTRKNPGTAIIYRPIHRWDAREVFAIARRHGLKPNPLYLVGASRVGCWPCINCRKKEIGLVANLTPEKIDFLREAERLVSLVSRRDQGGFGDWATFFSADKVPGDPADWSRAAIDKVVEWARTGRGGRQFDLLQEIERLQMEAEGAYCDSEYGLCE